MSVYQWKDGSRFAVPAQRAGEEIERISAGGNPVTASMVVDESRPLDAVLHPCFTWDDAKAAEMHRENEARQIIRHCYRVETTEQGEEKPVLGFVSVTVQEDRGYLATDVVCRSEDLRGQAVRDALAGLKGWQRRYAHLKELDPLMTAMEKALRKLERKNVGKPTGRVAARA